MQNMRLFSIISGIQAVPFPLQTKNAMPGNTNRQKQLLGYIRMKLDILG